MGPSLDCTITIKHFCRLTLWTPLVGPRYKIMPYDQDLIQLTVQGLFYFYKSFHAFVLQGFLCGGNSPWISLLWVIALVLLQATAFLSNASNNISPFYQTFLSCFFLEVYLSNLSSPLSWVDFPSKFLSSHWLLMLLLLLWSFAHPCEWRAMASDCLGEKEI